jgi:hypothetical protein
MQVYEIVRYNFVSVIGGRKHRECSLGPLPETTAEDAVNVVNWMINNEGILNIQRRVK